MLSFLKKGVLGVALGASALIAAAPAQAQRYDHYRGRGNNDAALAVGAGVLGLAVGAAIASNRNDGYYGERYYDRGYYAGPRYQSYYYGPRYRAYPPRGYYRDWRPRDGYYYDNPYRGRHRNW